MPICKYIICFDFVIYLTASTLPQKHPYHQLNPETSKPAIQPAAGFVRYILPDRFLIRPCLISVGQKRLDYIHLQKVY